jgi:hypothetical protein
MEVLFHHSIFGRNSRSGVKMCNEPTVKQRETHIFLMYTQIGARMKTSIKPKYFAPSDCRALSELPSSTHFTVLDFSALSTLIINCLENNFMYKLTVDHVVKKFPAFYGTRRFITVLQESMSFLCHEPVSSKPHVYILYLLLRSIFVSYIRNVQENTPYRVDHAFRMSLSPSARMLQIENG